MADDWTENTRTVGYSLRVTNELNAIPGKISDTLTDVTEAYSGNKAEEIEDRFGDIDLVEQTSRHEDTHYIDMTSTRRWIKKPAPADAAALLGRHDKQSTQVNIQAPVASAMARGVKRYHDNRFFPGFYGAAYMGEQGPETAVGFKAANIIEPVSGLNLAALSTLQKAYDDSDVDTVSEMPWLFLDTKGRQELLAIPEYKSADFNEGHPLIKGEIKPFMGFRFMMFNFASLKGFPLAQQYMFPAAGKIALPSFVPSGLHVGMWERFFSNECLNPSKKLQQQFYAEACSAMTRVDEGKCFQLVLNGR